MRRTWVLNRGVVAKAAVHLFSAGADSRDARVLPSKIAKTRQVDLEISSSTGPLVENA